MSLSTDQVANVLLGNDCTADKENASDHCPLSLVSYGESSFHNVPLANLDTFDAECLRHSWMPMTQASDETWC